MKFLICQYSHIEGYPPTFNAINVLADNNHEVIVLARKDLKTCWEYSKNVELNFIGNYKDRFEFEKTSKFHKIKEFFQYMKRMYQLIKRNKIDYILLYDNIPLMAYLLIHFLVKRDFKIWYHNHDINNIKDYKKYSLNYFAFFFERKAFKKINIFTLPAIERKQYFNLKKFEGKFFLLPNYPPLYLFNSIIIRDIQPIDNEIKLVYPGNIDNKHGFEELIPFLQNTIKNKRITLTLIGDIRTPYKNFLTDLAKKNNVANHLYFIERISYINMPEIISQYHIGIAINKPLNITRATGGSASNKIYEYAACGLPILLFDTPHYRKHLNDFNWSFFTDLTPSSINSCIENIILNYNMLSAHAKNDFIYKLNFEYHFIQTMNNII